MTGLLEAIALGEKLRNSSVTYVRPDRHPSIVAFIKFGKEKDAFRAFGSTAGVKVCRITVDNPAYPMRE